MSLSSLGLEKIGHKEGFNIVAGRSSGGMNGTTR
jgi:hypothetical protein